MTPRERAIKALRLDPPEAGDVVPHFELQMQLTEEYFGEHFATQEEWQASHDRAKLLRHDAELFLEIAARFDYCILFYSAIHRPTEDDFLEGIRVLRELDGGRHLLMCHGDSTLAIPSGSGMEELVLRLFETPEDVKAEQERRLEEMLELGRHRLEAGLDGFILCADYCFNTGPFLPPPMFSEFVTPYLTRLVRGYRRMGAWVIKHTDGDILPILDDLLEGEPHGLHSLDPMAGVDIAEVKRLVGDRACLCGNVNCALMQTGTDEQIVESCRYAMESGKPGGGYIFTTSNVIFKGMPQRSYELMLDYYRKHNRY